MEELLIEFAKHYLGPGAIGILAVLGGGVLTTLGIVRHKNNDALYSLAFNFFVWLDAKGEKKLGKLWDPIEKNLPSGIMVVARAAKDAFKNGVQNKKRSLR